MISKWRHNSRTFVRSALVGVLACCSLVGCEESEEVSPGNPPRFDVTLELSARLPVQGSSLPLTREACEALLQFRPVWQIADLTRHANPHIVSVQADRVEVGDEGCIWSLDLDLMLFYTPDTPTGGPQDLAELSMLMTAAFTAVPGSNPNTHVARFCGLDLPPPGEQEYAPFAYFTIGPNDELSDSFTLSDGTPLGVQTCSTGVLATDPRSYP